MHSLWVGIDPRPPRARVLVMAGAEETVLKARLQPAPKHPRAFPTLLEALALWQGVPVRAALAVGDEEPWCDMGLYRVGFDDFGQTPLYSVDVVSRLQQRRRRDELKGMGDFRDLRQLLLFEVAR